MRDLVELWILAMTTTLFIGAPSVLVVWVAETILGIFGTPRHKYSGALLIITVLCLAFETSLLFRLSF